jgi:hypothetical protein
MLISMLCCTLREVDGEIDEESFCLSMDKRDFVGRRAIVESTFEKLRESEDREKWNVPEISYRLKQEYLKDL